MELTLKYNEHATQALSGAFIRGNTPDSWLREMNAWQIPLEQLVCFIISQNNNPVDAAGLFVIFKKEQLPALLQVRHPYTVVGGKLFIPVDGELSPAISEPELQSLLMWDYQVFHPAIGFIGFENSDRIQLADLLQYTALNTIDWGYAHAGQSPWIPLHQINIQQPTAEEVFEPVKESINSKPLEEIPKANKKDHPRWLNNPVSEGLLKGVFFLFSKLSSILPGSLFGTNAGAGNTGSKGDLSRKGDNGKPGLFGKIMHWMAEKIEDLEKQRDSELKRLSDMFEKDTDEALQYAIPLSSPYLNRGESAPSARLSRRPLQFNLGRLGGGYAVDGWNLDNYYNDLRSKYIQAAQNAIARKDFKKAAYVYAHLLGDYSAAAATLRQGKHFREAAVLYKEHLSNPLLAATCLEEGGLYVEAIELYTSLNQHEKAGDLYMTLDQKEPALKCYEHYAEQAAVNKDYLEESRIIANKIGDRPRAKKVLLNGWQDVKQPEACLMKYFDLVADDNNEHLHSAIKTFYSTNDLAKKEIPFLSVIDKVNKKYQTAELESTCRDIAYKVVSEQLNAGNTASLHNLKDFVSDDQLLTPDCYRFMHTFKHVPRPNTTADHFQLMKDVVWKKAVIWQNQLLVWGVKSTGLVLARANWDGHIEYFTWNVAMQTDTSLLVAVDPDHTNNILLYADGVPFTDKALPKNKYFQDELIVRCPDFIPAKVIGISMGGPLGGEEIITLHDEHGEIFLNYYSLKGELIRSTRCTFSDVDTYYYNPGITVSEMNWCNGYFYMACHEMVLRVSEYGDAAVVGYGQGLVQKMAVSKLHNGYGSITLAYTYGDRILFMTIDEKINQSVNYEVKEIIAVDMKALPDNRFVVADNQKVLVYDMRDIDNPPEVHWQVETENEVVGVFQGPNRNQLGILEANGQITLHNIKESA
jgi:tetratricopeptide (TPR) repeat protein